MSSSCVEAPEAWCVVQGNPGVPACVCLPSIASSQEAVAEPKAGSRHWVQGALRSSLFLSLYCTLAWRGACVGFQWSSELLYASPSCL